MNSTISLSTSRCTRTSLAASIRKYARRPLSVLNSFKTEKGQPSLMRARRLSHAILLGEQNADL